MAGRPWVNIHSDLSRVGGERLFRHSVARMTSKSQTTAFGRGYILSPLTRLKALSNSFTPS